MAGGMMSLWPSCQALLAASFEMCVQRALGWLPTMVLLTDAFFHLPNQAKNC